MVPSAGEREEAPLCVLKGSPRGSIGEIMEPGLAKSKAGLMFIVWPNVKGVETGPGFDVGMPPPLSSSGVWPSIGLRRE